MKDGKKIEVLRLSKEEHDLLLNYRACDDRGKAAIIETAIMQLDYSKIDKADKFNIVKDSSKKV